MSDTFTTPARDMHGRLYPEPVKLWEVLVPVAWSTGVAVNQDHHKQWDARVRSVAGGLTLLKPVKGQWDSDDGTVHEKMIPVRVACTREQLDQILEFTAYHYQQADVMAYVVSDRVVFRRG